MSPAEIQGLLTERIGVRWSDDRLRDLDHFLARGLDTSDESALAEFMNGETYFFRYPLYLAVLQATLDRHQKDRPFRVLSAACSSGEETYSIAFALLDRAEEAGLKVEIVGSDVRPRAIAAAARGVYGQWSFRNLPAAERARYFEPVDATVTTVATPTTWRVKERYRKALRFIVRNLLDPVDDAPYDAALVCNATLYMEPHASQRVYERMAGCLRPDGLLLLAPTDPLPGASWAQADEYGGWSVFRRAEPLAKAPGPMATPSSGATPGYSRKGARDGDLFSGDVPSAPWLGTTVRGAPARAVTPAPPQSALRPRPAPSIPAGLSAVGSSADALWSAWANGSLASAQDELRQRIFLEPGSALWRFLHGVVLWEQGWLQRAASEIDRAALRAKDLADNESVAGLCTAEELRRMIQFWRSRHA